MENLVTSSLAYYTSNFQGKKVFVTGHTGFKGTWLLVLLDKLGALTKGYALAPENNKKIFEEIAQEITFESCIDTILNYDSLEREILAFQPDFIFHLAAQPLVRLSYEIPLETFQVNVIGTANVLNAARKLENACQIICITTDKVYHNKEEMYAYTENDPLGGYDPYSASKAACELVIDSYRKSYFNVQDFSTHQKGLASVRAGNVIGGGDWSTDRLLPDIMYSLQNDVEICVRNPNSIRPWQHVLEPLFGYLNLAIHLKNDPIKFGTSYNFGPSVADNLTVIEVVKQAIAVYGSGSYVVPELTQQPHEANLLQLDISKVKAHLNWEPKFSAAEAIALTVHWYKNHYHSTNAYQLIAQDIDRFFN
ncbi:CDP-glucose 4,6-dehydratase [Flavobacterium difficile]|uniref:CDP-glucose 4,6-dehydratase n=1 Tax=Flavobacterium difficile TaxID=2709659 RepID=A0ABX0I1M0_9FLAO|nr:CDP-glucose 4,6-dehydratase [Flavobacterium difficile]NHM01087.1 CDP-glucose 4,6-dehydratase [Flavobacterium difficile]